MKEFGPTEIVIVVVILLLIFGVAGIGRRFRGSSRRSREDNMDMSTATPAKPLPLSQLRKMLVQYFDNSEIRDLAFDLEVDFDSLRGESGTDKARELISRLHREGRLNELVRECAARRPHVQWKA
jgi:hypothetical protein